MDKLMTWRVDEQPNQVMAKVMEVGMGEGSLGEREC